LVVQRLLNVINVEIYIVLHELHTLIIEKNVVFAKLGVEN
jgi:hypothetical protein